MSALKVWCEECKGGIARRHLAYCPKCGVNGYIEREVVELPDGRAVVVDAKAFRTLQGYISTLDPMFTHPDGEDVRAATRAALNALFTGGVYEAEAVGRAIVIEYGHEPAGVGWQRLHTTRSGPVAPALDDGSGCWTNIAGDLIAIGLKEVGRGKA